jgi:hypothetical protein
LADKLTTLLCKRIIVVKSKEVKTRWPNSQECTRLAECFEEGNGSEKGCFVDDDDTRRYNKRERI